MYVDSVKASQVLSVGAPRSLNYEWKFMYAQGQSFDYKRGLVRLCMPLIFLITPG